MKNSENQFFVFWESTRKVGKSKYIALVTTLLFLMILLPTLYANWSDFIGKEFVVKIGVILSAFIGAFFIASLSWYINERRYYKMKNLN